MDLIGHALRVIPGLGAHSHLDSPGEWLDPRAVSQWGKLRYYGLAQQWLLARARGTVWVIVRDEQPPPVQTLLQRLAAWIPPAQVHTGAAEGWSWGPVLTDPGEPRVETELGVATVVALGAGFERSMTLAWGPSKRQRGLYAHDQKQGWYPLRRDAPRVDRDAAEAAWHAARMERFQNVLRELAS